MIVCPSMFGRITDNHVPIYNLAIPNRHSLGLVNKELVHKHLFWKHSIRVVHSSAGSQQQKLDKRDIYIYIYSQASSYFAAEDNWCAYHISWWAYCICKDCCGLYTPTRLVQDKVHKLLYHSHTANPSRSTIRATHWQVDKLRLAVLNATLMSRTLCQEYIDR